MGELYLDQETEQKTGDIGRTDMDRSNAVGDMSRGYAAGLSATRLHADETADRSADAFSAGRDTFFARSALRREAPGTGTPLTVEHSAPLGAEQGGLRSLFRRWFSGNQDVDVENIDDTSEEADLDIAEIPDDEEETAEPETAAPEAAAPAEQAVQGNDSRQKLLAARDKLNQTGKVGGGRNSARYDAVINAITVVTNLTRAPLSENHSDNLQKLNDMAAGYQSLVEACTAYNDRTALTSQGRARQKTVRQVLELAQWDLAGLGDVRTDILGIPKEELTSTTWSEMLGKARAIRLSVEDFSAMGKAEGGEVSDVRMLDGSNTTVHGRNGSQNLDSLKFFKKEDHMDAGKGIHAKWDPARSVALNEALKVFPNLPAQDREVLEEYVRKIQMGYFSHKLDPSDRLSDEGKTALNYLNAYHRKNEENINRITAPMGLLKEGGDVNFSRRNVATSRMANLLGLGHLVARSQTAEVYDEKTKSTIRGNLMDGAVGTDYDGMMDDKMKAKAAASDLSPLTGAFQRDLTSLQVLDVLCGQVDRHGNNLLYQKDEAGNLTGLQAIDNDASFGLNEDVLHTSVARRQDRRVYDPDGNMVLPYMDKALADRIMELEPEVVTFALQDLLRESEINAAVRRLQLIQNAIRGARTQEQEDGKKRFLEDGDWNEDTAGNMIQTSLDLEEKSLSKELKDKAQAHRANFEKQVILEELSTQGEANPEQAYEALLQRKKNRTATPDDLALFELSEGLSFSEANNEVARHSTANDTYFGRFFYNFLPKKK